MIFCLNKFLRLVEIGPRMTWKLMKIEEDVDSGEVLYHSHVEKTAKEVFQLRKRAPLIKYHKFFNNIKQIFLEKNEFYTKNALSIARSAN